MFWFTTALWLTVSVIWLRSLNPSRTDAATWTRRDDHELERLLSEGDDRGRTSVDGSS